MNIVWFMGWEELDIYNAWEEGPLLFCIHCQLYYLERLGASNYRTLQPYSMATCQSCTTFITQGHVLMRYTYNSPPNVHPCTFVQCTPKDRSFLYIDIYPL